VGSMKNRDEMASAGIVIIGAGMCGGNAAVTLREEGYRNRVVLIGDEPTPPFGRPPLSKTYLRGEEDWTAWMVKPPDWYEQNNVEQLHERVESIDVQAREVQLEDGRRRLAFDRLLLATGGRNRRLSVPGATLPGVLGLRTLANCDAIKEAAVPGSHAVVVGMGFIGSEVAASLRQLGVSVTAVLSGAGPLAGVLGDEVGSVMAAIHHEKGVELLLDDRVVAFTGHGHVEHVVTSRGSTVPCDFAVTGIGIEPAVELARESGVHIDNGIMVDERCRTNVADVYAAGDVANHLHPIFGRLRVEHYNNAERQGRAAARAMLGSTEQYADLHSFWSDQYEHALEYVGYARRWDQFVVRGSLEHRQFLGFYLGDGRVVAVMGLNRGGDPELDEDGELYALKALVGKRLEVPPASLEDEKTDLRSLCG
jgi:3-phenylpropionate/trans-cinnamate dioxygenase ferredoxin reductase subunit